MAEYRGLTIRIGADTTKFETALKAAQGAISSTDKQLRLLKQGLKLDPGNGNLVAKYMVELQEQAEAATSKVTHLRDEIAHIGESASHSNTEMTIEGIASGIENVALNVTRTKESLSDLTGRLATQYTEISQHVSDVVSKIKDDLKRTFSGTDLEREVQRQLRGLVDGAGNALVFNKNNNSIEDIRMALDAVISLQGVLESKQQITNEQADEYVAEVARLKPLWQEASNAYDDAKLVERLRNDENEAARLEARVSDLARQFVEMSEGSDLAKGWDEARKAIELITADAQAASTRFDALDEAMRFNPDNMQVAAARTNALQEAIILAEGKAEALSTVLDSFKSGGIDYVAGRTLQASENVERTRAAFEAAHAEVVRLESELEITESNMHALKNGGLEASDAYLQAEEQAANLRTQIEAARNAQDKANVAFQKARDVATYKEIEQQAIDAKNVVDKLRESYRQLAEAEVKALQPGNLTRGWNEAQEQIANFTDDMRNAGNLAGSVAKSLDFDPTNVELVGEHVRALADATTLAETKAEALQSQLDRFKEAGIDIAAEGVVSVSDNLARAEREAIDAASLVKEIEFELRRANEAKDRLWQEGTKGNAWVVAGRTVKNLNADLEEAQAASEAANAELEKAKDIVSYTQVKQQVADARTEVEGFGKAFADALVKTTTAMSDLSSYRFGSSFNVETAVNGLRCLDEEAAAAKARLDVLDTAIKIDPTNIETVGRSMYQVAELTDQARAKAAALEDVLAAYASEGIDRVADNTENLTQAAADASERFSLANGSITSLTANIERAEGEMQSLNLETQEGRDRHVELWRATRQWNEALAEAKTESSAAATELKRVNEAIDFRQKQTELQSVRNEIEQLTSAAGEYAIKLADALNGEAMAETGPSRAMELLRVALDGVSAEADHARERFEAFNSVSSVDTNDIDAAAQSMSALSGYIDAANAKAEALRSMLSAYEETGIDTIAAGAGNLSEALASAQEQLTLSNNAVATLEANIQAATHRMENLDTTTDEGADEYLQLAEAVDAWERELDQASQAASEAKAEVKDFSSAINFREVDTALAETVGNIKQLEQAYIDMASNIAKNMAGVTLSPKSFDLTVAKEELGYLSTEAERAQYQFELLDKAAKLHPSDISLAKERMAALRDATEATREKANKLREIIARYKDAGIDKVLASTKNLSQEVAKAHEYFEAADNAVKQIKADIAVAEQQMAKLRSEGKGNTEEYQNLERKVEGFRQELERAESAANQLGQEMSDLDDAVGLQNAMNGAQEATHQLDTLNQKSSEVAENMTTALFMAIQQIGQAAKQVLSDVSSATYDLEEAYTSMLKTVDGTDEQYAELKDAAIAASLENPVTADQILKVEALGGQLGFTVEELQEFQRVANGLDISTNMGWEDAATNMAQFFNIMKTGHDEVGRYGSAIVDLGNNFATTEADISDMAMRIAGAGATLGLSEADVLGLSTALTSMGLTAEAGGSSISQIMISIEKSVANGTDGIKKYADEAGMSVGQFVDYINSLDSDALSEYAAKYQMTASQFKKTTTDAFEHLKLWSDTAGYDAASEFAKAWESEPIEALQRIFKGMTPEALEDGTNLSLLLDELGVKTIRQSDVARRLANNADLLTDAVSTANRAWEDNVALDTEVERRNESLSGRMDVLTNTVTALKTELGEGLAPVIGIATDAVRTMVGILDGMSTHAKSMLITVTAIATGAAAATVPVLALGSAMKAFTGAETISAAFSAFGGGILSFVTNPAVAAVGAIAALGLATYSLYNTIKNSTKEQDDFNNEIARMGSVSSDARSKSVGLFDHFSGIDDATLSVEQLTDRLKEYNDAVEQNDAQSRATNHNLEAYSDVLDKYKTTLENTTDAEDLSVGAKSELQWALDGLNQELGTHYTLEDLVADAYENEEGEISSLMDHLDELIEKRQYEARMAADANKLQESYEARRDALDSYVSAHNQLNEVQGRYNELLQGAIDDGLTQEAAMKHASDMIENEYGVSIDELTKREEAAKEAYDALNDSIDYNQEVMAKDTALMNAKINVEDFQDALLNAQVGVDEFYNLSSDDFNKLMSETGGNMDQMVEWMRKYHFATSDAGEAVKKLAEEDVPRYGEALSNAGINIDDFAAKCAEMGVSTRDIAQVGMDNFALLAATCGGDIDLMVSRIQEYNQAKLEGKEVTIDAEGNVVTGEAADKIKKTQGATDDLQSKTVQVDVEGNAKATETANNIWDTVRAIWNLSDKTVTVRTNNVVTESKAAAGGIRFHAYGGIVDRPSWLGTRDIVGEAGAEAIIPLTNRKYVSPFADTVAEELLQKMGTQSGDNITIQLNYEAGTDANQMVRELARGIQMHKATKGRW